MFWGFYLKSEVFQVCPILNYFCSKSDFCVEAAKSVSGKVPLADATIYPGGNVHPCSFCSHFRYIKIGDKECEFSPAFRLILHTKLANPHFQPELQAQCTLINFTVTRDGLEEQLLAAVVNAERPDLEQLKVGRKR